MIKIALADDETLLRDTLSDIINRSEGMQVIMRAKNGRECVNAINEQCMPDIVLLDVNMPEMDGFETANYIIAHFPDIKVLILTMYDTELVLIKLLQSGVRGFLKKDIPPEELIDAIRIVELQGYYYNQYATNRLLSAIRKNAALEKTGKKSSSTLNDTEMQFLKLACNDLTYKEIAVQMNISPRTIDNYRDALFEKLQVRSRVGLAVYAFKNGLIHFSQ